MTSRLAAAAANMPAWPWLAAAFFLISIATSISTLRVPQATYRYLFVIDITQSMNVADINYNGVATSRLDFAKIAVAQAIGELPCGSEAGLAIFSAHRTFVFFTPVEVCEHFDALHGMLRKIDWRMAWQARSEIAKGLYSAMRAALQSEEDTHVVFLSDGHEAPPVHADIRPSLDLEPGAVRGFVGGIGGAVPAPIPRLDANNSIIGHWTREEVMQIDLYSMGRPGTQKGEAMVGINMVDISRRIAMGQEHLSALREGYLRELAITSGLDYFRVDSVEKLLRSLKRDSYGRRTAVATDLGWIPATLAFALLLYCFIVLPKRVSHFGGQSDRAIS